MNEFRLNILCKAPIAGKAKTRLAAGVGDVMAHRIYSALLQRLFLRLSALHEVSIHLTPFSAKNLIEKWLQPGWRVVEQAGGGLGDRITATIQSTFDDGVDRTVVIGSDCPDLELENIYHAFKMLETHEFVIGPTHDGGYWLIGVRNRDGWSRIFAGIPWSSDKVFQETLYAAESIPDASIGLLPHKSDLDTAQDWVRLIDKPKLEG